MEEVMSPGPFCGSNSTAKMVDGALFLSASGRMNQGEGNSAILVPPADPTGVWEPLG